MAPKIVVDINVAGVSSFLAAQFIMIYTDIVIVYYVIEYGNHKRWPGRHM